jgi:hypothetical protein
VFAQVVGDIPSSLGQRLTALTYLGMRSNPDGANGIGLEYQYIDGDQLSPYDWALTALTALTLHGNTSRGATPSQLGDLTALITSYLTDN